MSLLDAVNSKQFPQLDNTFLDLDNSSHSTQPHSIIVHAFMHHFIKTVDRRAAAMVLSVMSCYEGLRMV